MRKTQEYFAGKLRKMYRTNAFSWLHRRMYPDDFESDESSRSSKMYHQYYSLDDVEQKFTTGKVLSGFYTEDMPETIMIAYGNKRCSGKMNAVKV